MRGPTHTMALPLTACRNGDSGVVTEIAGSCEITKRLSELGVHEGAQLSVLRAGTPMIVCSGNSRFCLRAEMAESILVSLGTTSPASTSPA